MEEQSIEIEKSNIVQNEITSYLNIIQNMTQLIEHEKPSIYTKTIKTSCNKIKNMLDTVTNTNYLTNDLVDISHLINDIIHNYQLNYIKKNLILITDIHPINVQTNECLLERLLVNVIKTIIKYSSQNNDVKISTKFTYPYVVIQFRTVIDSDNNPSLQYLNSLSEKIGCQIETIKEDNYYSLNVILPIHPDLPTKTIEC